MEDILIGLSVQKSKITVMSECGICSSGMSTSAVLLKSVLDSQIRSRDKESTKAIELSSLSTDLFNEFLCLEDDRNELCLKLYFFPVYDIVVVVVIELFLLLGVFDLFFIGCKHSFSIPFTASFASCIKLVNIPEIRSNASSCLSSSSTSDNNAIAESGLVIVSL